MLSKINLKKVLGVCALALIVTIIAVEPSQAQTTAVDSLVKRMVILFQSVRTIIFVIGGFGLIGLAMGAIFGNIDWKWVGALAFGLFIVAIAGSIIETIIGVTVVSITDVAS